MNVAAELLNQVAPDQALFAVEVLPPDSVQELGQALQALKEAGVHLLFLSDSSVGAARVDPMVAAARAMEMGGPVTIPHLNCRDRNLIGLENARKTCRFLGLPGIRAVTGSPVSKERGRGVYDVRSPGLTRLLRRHYEVPEIAIFVNHGPNHPDVAAADQRLRSKIEAGAQAVITMPTLDAEGLAAWYASKADLEIPLLLGLTWTPTMAVLDYVLDQIPSFGLPAGFRDRLAQAKGADEARPWTLKAAIDVAEAVGCNARGYVIAPPYGRWQGAVPIIKALREGIAD